MSDENYYAQGPSENPSMDMGPTQLYGGPSGGVPIYGDGQASLTDMRTSYGSDMLGMLAYGAASGISVVGHGAYNGANRMMADLGGMVRPISYTPPARVYTGFSGRVQQRTGFFKDIGAMTGMSDAPRGTSPYLYGLNAASDFGERVGGMAGGLGVSVATIGVTSAFSSMGGAAFGGVGALAGGLAGYAVAGYAADKVYEGVATRRQTQDYLERTSNTYIGAGSKDADPRLGGGFSRAARQNVSEFVRGMDINDKMFDGGDLQKVLEGSTNLGMFAGTSGVADFKKKFKTIVDSLKVVTTTLNQTLEEGLHTMKELKGVGIAESSAGSIAMQAQSYGKMAGRSALEMVNVGLQGAEIFRGTGVTMGIGFQANIMNLASVRAGRDAGMISQEAVSQAGGEEALAQRMTGSTLAYTQSQVGRGYGGMYAGRGGTFDQGAFMNALNGNMDAGGAALSAARRLGSPKALIEYEVNQAKMRSEQGQMFGGRGLDIGMLSEAMIQGSSISQMTGVSREMGTKYTLKGQGMSDAEIEARLAEVKNPQAAFVARQQSAMATYNQAQADQATRNGTFHRLGETISDTVKSIADTGGARAISGMYDSTADAVVTGFERHIQGKTRYDKNQIADTTGIVITDKDRAAADARSVNLDDTTVFSFRAKQGEALAGFLRKKGGLLTKINMKEGAVKDAGSVILEEQGFHPGIGKKVASVSREDLAKISEEAQLIAGATPESSRALKESGALKESDAFVSKRMREVSSEGAGFSGMNGDYLTLVKTVFKGRTPTAKELASLTNEIGQNKFLSSTFGGSQKEVQEGAAGIVQTNEEVFVKSQAALVEEIKTGEKDLGVDFITDPQARAAAVRMLAANTPEGRAKAAEEVKIYTQASGASQLGEGKLSQLLDMETLSDSASRGKAAALGGKYGQSKYLDSVRGAEILTMGTRIVGAKANLSKEEISIVGDAVTSFGGGDALKFANDSGKMQQLKDAVAKAPADLGHVYDEATIVKGLGSVEGIADKKERSAAINKLDVSADQRKRILDFNDRGISAVQAANEFSASAVGKQGETGATTGTTANQEALAVQSNMNKAVLKAFETLAIKLGAFN